MLDAILEYESTKCQKDMSSGVDMHKSVRLALNLKRGEKGSEQNHVLSEEMSKRKPIFLILDSDVAVESEVVDL